MSDHREAMKAASIASREKFIADNKLVIHHIIGNANERVEQWDWPKAASGGKYDHYLLIQTYWDESWSVSIKIDAAPHTDIADDTTKALKAIVAVMDGKAFIAK